MNGHRPSLHTDLSNDRFQVVGPYDLSHLAIEVFPVQEPPPSPTVSMAVLRRRLGRCCEVRSDSQLLFLTMGFFPQSRLSPDSFDCDCKNPLYTRSAAAPGTGGSGLAEGKKGSGLKEENSTMQRKCVTICGKHPRCTFLAHQQSQIS